MFKAILLKRPQDNRYVLGHFSKSAEKASNSVGVFGSSGEFSGHDKNEGGISGRFEIKPVWCKRRGASGNAFPRGAWERVGRWEC